VGRFLRHSVDRRLKFRLGYCSYIAQCATQSNSHLLYFTYANCALCCLLKSDILKYTQKCRIVTCIAG